MRKLLLLLALEVGILASVQSATTQSSNSTTGCPLNFEDAVTPPDNCLPEAHNGLTSEHCCYITNSSLAGALAANTNGSYIAHQLFLDESSAEACAADAQKLTTPYCGISPPAFTANQGPCLFPNMSQLQDALKNSSVSFSNLAANCTDVQNETGCFSCQSTYYDARLFLGNQLEGGDSADINCGTALLVALASQDMSSKWQYSLYSCLETFFTPALDESGAGSARGMQNKSSVVIPLLAALLGILFFMFLALLALINREKKRGSDQEDNYSAGARTEHSEQHTNEGTLYEFSARELSRATDGYSEKNAIGEGSAGKVFKGIIPSGQVVAIKVINNDKNSKNFYKEIENLSRVRHPNLVTLLGYCQTADKNLLVYEYCSKGNLWNYLFGAGHALNWDQRLYIALGSARGLMYLHVNPGGYIVHRDIKPTNILLTENYEAKVSDFGLSRSIAIEESRVFTEVKGTAGYLDPEYLNQGTLTFSSDVYSFGIVLLQLVSGRRPIDLEHKTRFSLVKMANLVVKRKAEVSDYVDPRLEGVYNELTCRKVIEIAVQCTSDQGVYRPSMIEVRQSLEEAWALGGSPISYKATTQWKAKYEAPSPASPSSSVGTGSVPGSVMHAEKASGGRHRREVK